MAIKDIKSLSKEQLIELILKRDSTIDAIGKKALELENTLIELNNKYDELNKKYGEQSIELQKAKELLVYYSLLTYNKNRLRIEDTDTPTLFDVMGVEEPEKVEFTDTGVVVKEHVRKHQPKTEHFDYSLLPHEDAPGEKEAREDMYCDNCGAKMHCYKTEIKEELVFIPAQAKVVVHYIHHYKCDQCVNDKDHNPCKVGKENWKPLFNQSVCSPSLLASIIDYKYDKGLPLNTIERIYGENGIVLPRQNMSNWLIKSMEFITPLFDLMRKDLLAYNVLAADETVVQVIKEAGRLAEQISYLWQYQTSIWDKRIILFDYEPGRNGDFAAEFLDGYNGYLVSDKYTGYNKVGAKRCYCHIHAMRYIREAYEILPKETRNESLEYEAYKKYQKIFKIDNDIQKRAKSLFKDDIDAQLNYIYEQRLKKDSTLDAFEMFLLWLNEIRPKALYKPKFLKAIDYVLNDSDGFKMFAENARIPLGNNGCEILFKPFILHRSRCKFFFSAKGADAAAKIYSLMITAKENGYSTFAYFNYLFENIKDVDLKDEEALRKFLPYEGQLPEYCKMMSIKELKNKIKDLENDKK